ITSVSPSDVGSGNVVANAVLAERPVPKPATMPSAVRGAVAAKLGAGAPAKWPRGARGGGGVGPSPESGTSPPHTAPRRFMLELNMQILPSAAHVVKGISQY